MSRLRKLALLAATAAAFCLSVSPALAGSHASPHHPAAQASAAPSDSAHLQFSAVALGRENYFFPDQAQQTRQRIDSAGFQGERVVIVWNGSAVPDHYDLDAACNAAQVSSGQKVLMLNLRPDRNSWPADEASLGAFEQTIDTIDARVFWGTGSNGQPCWPSIAPPQQFMWMVGNEPNSHDFCNGDSSTSDLLAIHRVCAQREALLLHRSYAFIKGQNWQDPSGQQGKYGHLIMVVGGGLSSHDAPYDYLSDYLKDRTVLGYKTCDMDYFGFHPYALNATDPYSGFRSVETKLVPALKAAGCPLKVIYTEMGVETVTPTAPGFNYNGTAPIGVCYVREDQMPAVYQQFIKLMQSQPDVIGFMNFEIDDEQGLNGWQSGFNYFSGFPKPFVPVLRPILAGIGNGTDNGPPG
jgi:hypothetical protein